MNCSACRGSGICPTCGGAGQAWCRACAGTGATLRDGAPARCEPCAASGIVDCPARCAACAGRGHVLATLEQALTSGVPPVDLLPTGTGLLLVAIFLSFAFEGVDAGYRYRFWLYGPQALGGQWWQFVTSLFLHANLLQLGFNTAALFVFGPPLETAVGTRPFLVIYLLSGVTGNILSVAAHPRIQTVGASGCLFGIAGAWVGLQARRTIFPPRVVALLLGYVALMLVIGFLADAGLNNVAHLGGFVQGLLSGLALAPAAQPQVAVPPPARMQEAQPPVS